MRVRGLPVLLVLLGLVGCQSAVSGRVDPLDATTAPTGIFAPAPVVNELPANRVTLPWSLVGMSSDGRRLFISYGVGDGCGDHEGCLFVREAPEYVGIASAPVASGPFDRSAGNACAAVLKTANGYVDLTDPLGARKLIHLDQPAS